jgi:hypothetical protein
VPRKIESELRFFVPFAIFEKIIEDAQPTHVTQSYLPPALIPKLLRRHRINERVSYSNEFSTARIRASSSSCGGTLYELEFKAPKIRSGEMRISRLVLPAPVILSESEFQELANDATEGTLVKNRYLRTGSIYSNGATIPCVAEIDEFLAGGAPLRRFIKPLVTLDLELPDETLVDQLISGSHSFEFLRYCPDMNYMNTKVSAPLSNRKIALHGLGRRQTQSLRELRRISEKLL